MSRIQPTLGRRIRARLGSWWLIGGLGVLYFISQAIIGSILHALDPSTVLELQTTLSSKTFAGILGQWRETGLLETYWRHYYFDFPHPFLYSTFLAALLSKAFDANDIDHRYDNLLIIPFGAGALDLVENLCHVTMLLDADAITAPRVVLSGIAANLKWLGALACIAAVAMLAVRAGFRKAMIP